MTDTTKFTDDQLVSKYIEIREFLAKEAATQEAFTAPWVKAMDAISGVLHQRLLERNPAWRSGVKASSSTEHGTFFLKTVYSTKMADREAFHQFLFALVREGRDAEARAFLTAHVAKEAVEEYIEKHSTKLPDGQVQQALPPGVTVEPITTCQVRKT